jgi:hypothetical protein
VTATDIVIMRVFVPKLTSATVGAGTIGETELADLGVTQAKLAVGAAGAGLTGLIAKFLANANVIGAIPVIHEIDIADASGNTDVVFTHKERILDAWIQNTGAAAHATDDHVQIINQTGPVTLTEELAKTATQYAIKHFATIIDPVIAAGDTVRVTAVKVTNVACKLFILGARVA